MNAIVKVTYSGEVIPPGERCRVIVAHPLRGRIADRTVRAGCTIREALHAVLDVPASSPLGVCDVWVNGEPIPEVIDGAEWWSRVRLKPGSTLAFVVRLQGRNALRAVLGIAIALAAAVIAPYLAGPALLGFAAGTTAFSVASGLIGAGIILAGTMALNALLPARPPAAVENGGASTARVNSIQGAQNQAAPFEAIPVVLGRHRQSPFYAAKPYTEIVGDDQYVRMLFCWGYGAVAIEDLKIGETPLASFSDYEIEHRNGYGDDAPITLYPGQVDEEALSINLISTDGPSIRTTNVDTDEISIDITAPEGIFQVNTSSGAFDDYLVYCVASWRPVGGTDWTAFATFHFTRSTTTVRKGARVALPRGQYEVQVVKQTPEQGNDKIKEKVVWTALRSIRNLHPVHFGKPLALTALRIKATDQLSGVINTFNGITTSAVIGWNGAAWVPNVFSKWPADLIRHVLQGPMNARPVPDAQIDLENLQEFHAYCVANGFEFNQVRTRAASVYDTVADIAAAGRAVPTFVDGKWGVVWDRPADAIVQHFTPRNSWGFQGERTYVSMPHGWRVKFVNEENGFTQDEIKVYDDGYDATSATLFEAIEFPGVTKPSLNWKHGRFHIAQARLRPESITLQAGWDNLVCTRGDRVAVTHDVMLVGLMSGRIKSVAGQVITFDEPATIEAGKTYGFRFRVPQDARSITRSVDLTGVDPGEYMHLTLVGDLGQITPGTLFGFGETGQESANYRVLAIRHRKDLIATLVLVDDAPAISQADQGEIPAYTPNVTIPPDPFTLPPRDLKYQEIIDGQGASVRALIVLSWQVPRFGRIASFQVQERDDIAGADWVTVASVTPPSKSVSVPLVAAGTWSFRVRCLFTDGTASSWEALEHLQLLGLARVPGPVENLRNTFISGRSHLIWDRPIDPRVLLVEIRKGESFDAAQIIDDDATSPWLTVGDDTYWVTTYVVSPFGERIYSSPRQSIEIEGSVAVQNVVVTNDERAGLWNGYFAGTVGVDTDQNFLRTSGDAPFLARADFLGETNFLDSQDLQQGGYFWSKRVVNIGRLGFCRISNNWTATGVPVDDDFLGNPSFLDNPDFLKSYLSQYVRVRPVVRISRTGPGDAFAEADIFAPDDAFLAGTNWQAPVVWSPDVYEGWLFQLGMQFEILPTDDVPDPGAIAYLLSWDWTIDVPDRMDSYQNLTVPAAGLQITFRPNNDGSPAPFNGGLNNEALPHLSPSIRNPMPGDDVVWENLTLSGVTLFVKNNGNPVTRTEVNLFARGY